MQNKFLLGLAGAVSLIGGIFALFNPFAASLTVEQLAGWLFLFSGVIWLIGTFRAEGWGSKIWSFLVGLALTWLGISLLANPLGGVATLTLVVALSFVASGIFKIMLAYPARQVGLFWVVLLSGVISLVLGLMILANFPASAVTILGLLLAIELISNGISMLILAMSASEPRHV